MSAPRQSHCDSPRARLLMDAGWRFHLGEVGGAAAISHDDTYSSVKAGMAGGAASPAFDDSAWRCLDLPHDWLVEQPYDPTGNVSHGFRRGDVAWYRRQFDLPTEDLGKRLWLEFDGIFRNSTVWLNGHLLGNHVSGYSSFWFDVTDVANYGGSNVVSVRVDASEFEGWWYEGAGIYRHVWLTKTAPLHIEHWGMYVTATVDHHNATVSAQALVSNDGDEDQLFELLSTLLDADGNEVAREAFEVDLMAWEAAELTQELTLTSPHLWDVDDPYLYALRTELHVDGTCVDAVLTPVGIRTIAFDPERGFHLNGRPLKLKGTCNHQDHAGVGVALPDALQDYRIRRLKEMGSNAYRTAHNPPTPELLDACDRLGMLVMAENRHLSSSTQGLADLETLILRDRNHPSIIMWSMANEEPLQDTEVGARIVSTLNRVTRTLDPTRPTTTAMHGGWGGAFSLAHDVQGCNYSIAGYDAYHGSNPDHPILGSETSSAVTTRGVYITDPARGYLSAYDVNAPEWGSLAETAWRAIADRPFMAGTFVWTGFDYRGEPTPYQWPCINSHFGIMDTCGFPKDNFFYYQSWWSDQTVLHILPHWNWPERVGESIAVWVHGNCDEVELLLNGTSLGRKHMERNGHLEWDVTYAPGELLAVGYHAGAEVARSVRETTGPAAQVCLSADRPAIRGDGADAVVVNACICDAEGRVVPIADDLITFAISDNATILGVGNGDPSCHDPDKANWRRAFSGWCQAIVQANSEATGLVTVHATAAGLLPAEVVLPVETCPGLPRI